MSRNEELLEKIKKDYHEVNLVVPWSLAAGISFFIIFSYFIWVIEFDIFRNPQIVTDDGLRYGLLVVAFLLAVEMTRIFNRMIAGYINKKYQARFHHIKEMNSYYEARETVFFTEKKYDHVVLILHGFSASPQEFQFLTPYLEKNGINYYTPNLAGFGLDNTTLLNKTKRQDWYRNSLLQYDALSKLANKVSVVGHSMGGILAAYIAANRSVHQLILTAPGFYPIESHLIHKKLLTTPIISSIYTILIPYVPKALRKERGHVSDTLDAEVVKQMFHYLAVPLTSAREVFLMQDEAHLNKMRFDNLSIIYGRHEQTINMEKLFKALDMYNVKYKSYCMENSAHNILEDFDRDECCQLVTDILLGNK